MCQLFQRCREKSFKKKQVRKDEKELHKIQHEEQLKRCNTGNHDWEVSHEIQGDGDTNTEGYILITRTTCRICHLSEVKIEPYENDSNNADD